MVWLETIPGSHIPDILGQMVEYTAKLLNFLYRQILQEEKKSRGYSYCRMFAKGENHALDQSGRPA